MEESSREQKAIESEEGTVDPHELVSSDDEVDYSVKPEFYDPNIDDVDELWAHKQRKGQNSDAILSCPACFTTLCLDCQRHEKYVTQYRAMFVRNCKVRTDQILRQGKQKRRNSKAQVDSTKSKDDVHNDSVFRPVCCAVCSTEVGVLDEEEIYHFFNVIPSNS
ncbi:uncharacterized protein [Typha angustifolia]|uniref:uncharacterized protein isoform X2 n=1 Tax=Typha angustifolia TaxID=59011 RepID=UPI003C2AEF1C